MKTRTFSIYIVFIAFLAGCATVPLNKNAQAPRVYAGFFIQELYPFLAEDLGLSADQKGMLIIGVSQGSPAEATGLQEGDVVVRTSNAKGVVIDAIDLKTYFKTIENIPDDQPIILHILRGKKELTVSVLRKPEPPGPPRQPTARQEPRIIKVAADKSGDCLTLARAMLLSRPGDTILIKNVLVNNSPVVYTGITVTRDKLTIASLDAKKPAHVNLFNNANGISDLTIKSLAFHPGGTARANWPALTISNARQVLVEKCHIENFSVGVVVTKSTDVHLDGNTITGNSLGVGVNNGSSASITHNLIVRNSPAGGVAVYGSQVEISNNTIIENKVLTNEFNNKLNEKYGHYIPGVGVEIGNSSSVAAYSNIIAANNVGFLVDPSSQAIIEYNDVFQHIIAGKVWKPSHFFETTIKGSASGFLVKIEREYIMAPPFAIGVPHRTIFTPITFQPSSTNINIGPLFADPFKKDYRLAADSPLATKGRNKEYIGAFPPVGPPRSTVTAKLDMGYTKPVVASDVDTLPLMQTKSNPNAYAVVIGIENYRQKLPKVDFAVHDAMIVAEYLTKALGFPEENIVTLANEHASKSDFEKYFEKWLGNNVEKDGSVFIYYSGHGAPNPKSGDAYLVPYDGDPSFIEQTGYSLKRMYEVLGKLPAKEVLVVLDSCFSGAGGRSVIAKGARPLVMNLQKTTISSLNMTIMAAASGNQISSTYDKKGHGLFTYYMLKGIKNEEMINPDGSIAINDLFSYIKPQVERIARKIYNNEQTPQLIGAKKN